MKRYFLLYFIFLSKLFSAQQYAAIVSTGLGKTCIINEKEEVIYVPVDGAELCSIKDGILRIKVNGKYGYRDCYGKEILTAKFERAEDFFENRARVRVDGKWGYINKKGDVVIPAVYKTLYDFREGRALVKANDGFIFIDTTGKQITGETFDKAHSFSCNRAWVKTGGKWGAIDRNGVMKIPALYFFVQDFSEGVAAVMKEADILGYVDTLNNIFINFNDRNKMYYYLTLPITETLKPGDFPDVVNQRFYYTEQYVTPYSCMSSGLMPVFNQKFGFANKEKAKVIKDQFGYVTNFFNGYAIIGGPLNTNFSKGGNVINTSGELLIKDGVNMVKVIYNDIAVVKRNGLMKFEYVDLKGRFTFKHEYVRADAFSLIK